MDQQRPPLPEPFGSGQVAGHRSAVCRWRPGALVPRAQSMAEIGDNQFGVHVAAALAQKHGWQQGLAAAGARPPPNGGAQPTMQQQGAPQPGSDITAPVVSSEDLLLQDALHRLDFAAWVAERGRANAAKHAARVVSSAVSTFKGEAAGVLAAKILGVLDKGLLSEHRLEPFISETVSWSSWKCSCGEKLTLNLAGACGSGRHDKNEFATVYGLAGVRPVLHLARRCNGCNKRYYQTFATDRSDAGGEVEHRLCLKASAVDAIWWISPGVGVDVSLLNRMHLRFFRTHATFGGDAAVAAMEEHGLHDDENASPRHRRRRECSHCRLAWYQWRLALAQEAMVNAGVRFEGGKQFLLFSWDGVEAAIAEMWPQYSAHWRRKWATNAAEHHSGNVQEVVVLDAHQKGTRARCGTDACHELTSDSLGVSATVACPETPRQSKYHCAAHAPEVEPVVPAGGVDPSDLDYILKHKYVKTGRQFLVMRASVGYPTWIQEEQLPVAAVEAYRKNESKPVLVSAEVRRHRLSAKMPAPKEEYNLTCTTCKETGAAKFHERTAGIMIAAFPSGIIADWTEIYGSESRVQRYMFIASVLSACPSLRLIVHDDACHMAKYARHLNRFCTPVGDAGWWAVSSTPMRVKMAELLWSLDRFHSSNHTDQWCHDNVNPELPELQRHLQGVNTSICESVFAWIRNYAGSLHNMSRWRFVFFISEMLETHNQRVAAGLTEHLGRHHGEDLGRPE